MSKARVQLGAVVSCKSPEGVQSDGAELELDAAQEGVLVDAPTDFVWLPLEGGQEKDKG